MGFLKRLLGLEPDPQMYNDEITAIRYRAEVIENRKLTKDEIRDIEALAELRDQENQRGGLGWGS